MGYVIASIAILAVLGIVNLFISVSIIHRLRREGHQVGRLPMSGPPVGSRVPAFQTVTINGEALTDANLRQGRQAVLAFLAAGCPACPASVPHLLSYVDESRLGVSDTIVVVNGGREDREVSEIIEALESVATIAVEPADGPTARAFGVTHFPTFVFIGEDGLVEQSQLGSGPLRPRIAA
ncbi:MAG: redoxin family protein [Micromonosporaceae bacterium]